MAAADPCNVSDRLHGNGVAVILLDIGKRSINIGVARSLRLCFFVLSGKQGKDVIEISDQGERPFARALTCGKS